jgi:hypothetical protein
LINLSIYSRSWTAALSRVDRSSNRRASKKADHPRTHKIAVLGNGGVMELVSHDELVKQMGSIPRALDEAGSKRGRKSSMSLSVVSC